jgi:hypothetical protein
VLYIFVLVFCFVVLLSVFVERLVTASGLSILDWLLSVFVEHLCDLSKDDTCVCILFSIILSLCF